MREFNLNISKTIYYSPEHRSLLICTVMPSEELVLSYVRFTLSSVLQLLAVEVKLDIFPSEKQNNLLFQIFF